MLTVLKNKDIFNETSYVSNIFYEHINNYNFS